LPVEIEMTYSLEIRIWWRHV